MIRRRNTLKIVLATLATAAGCAKTPDPAPATEARTAPTAKDDEKAAAGTGLETRLPAVRPTPFSVNYQSELVTEERDTLHLADDITRLGTSRGRRHFKVSYASDPATLDRVYAALRDNACDRIKTEITRNPGDTGTILQLRAGKVHHVINDRGKFFPAAEWTDAYKACASASNDAFVVPGDRPSATFEVQYADEKIAIPLLATIDLGPDFLGLVWGPDQRKVTIHSAKIRPVEVISRSGKTEERTLLDLATHDVVVIKSEGDPQDGSFRVLLSTSGGPAKTTGEVPTGTDERVEVPPKVPDAVAGPDDDDADDDAPPPAAPEGKAPAPEGKAPAPEGKAPEPEGKAPAPEGKPPEPESKAPDKAPPANAP